MDNRGKAGFRAGRRERRQGSDDVSAGDEKWGIPQIRFIGRGSGGKMSSDENGGISALHAEKEGIQRIAKPIFAGIFLIEQLLEPKSRFSLVDETPVDQAKIRFVDETLRRIYVGGSFIRYRRAGSRRWNGCGIRPEFGHVILRVMTALSNIPRIPSSVEDHVHRP